MNNGKGSTSRPLSVDQETFANNWDRIFNNTTCEYSGLVSTSSYQDEPPKEYSELLSSGKFWEVFPGLTGTWTEDKSRWVSIALIKEIGNKL
jgi:hypothetical protein